MPSLKWPNTVSPLGTSLHAISQEPPLNSFSPPSFLIHAASKLARPPHNLPPMSCPQRCPSPCVYALLVHDGRVCMWGCHWINCGVIRVRFNILPLPIQAILSLNESMMAGLWVATSCILVATFSTNLFRGWTHMYMQSIRENPQYWP